MGMRKYRRQIAKAVLTDAGVGNVNKKFSTRRGGVPLWRRALEEHARICRKIRQGKANRIVRRAAKA